MRGVCIGSWLILEDNDYYIPEIGYKLAMSKSPKLRLIGSECLGTEIGYQLLKPSWGAASLRVTKVWGAGPKLYIKRGSETPFSSQLYLRTLNFEDTRAPPAPPCPTTCQLSPSLWIDSAP